jgi:hypothetical protein
MFIKPPYDGELVLEVDGLLLQLPTGQITNHYKEDWDLFKIPN